MTPCALCPETKARIRKCLCPPEKRKPMCNQCAEAHGCDTSHVNVAAWKKANAGEEKITSAAVEALNLHPAIEEAWQAKKRGGARPGQVALRVPDVLAYTKKGAVLIGIELKASHRDDCSCEGCEGQRDWGRRLVARGGIYIPHVRSVAEALARVSEALAARGAA